MNVLKRDKFGGGTEEVTRKIFSKEMAFEIGTTGGVGFQPTAFTA